MARISLLCLVGCGRLGFDPVSPLSSELPPLVLDDFPLVSVDPAALPPFGTAERVPGLSLDGVDDDDPTLSRDQLEIFFDRLGEAHDLFTARRASIDDAWSEPVPVRELNSGTNEEHPSLSADALTLHFTSGRGGDPQIHVSTRPDRNSPWSEPFEVPGIGSNEREEMGALSGDELSIVFASRRGGLTLDELYQGSRADPMDTFGVARIDELSNTDVFERSPVLDDFGLVVHYDRGSSTKIVWAQRANVGAPWSGPFDLAGINTSGIDESDPWLTPDQRTIYFVIGDQDGTRDIYFATR